jgi:predicted phage tail protein
LGFTTGIDSTNITVNVSPNGNWKFQATAIYGDVGESAPNAALTVFVQAAPAPSVFQPLTTRVGSTYNASISWSSALHDYYVTNYIARLTKQGITQTVTTTATSTTFTGLTAGRYDFSVVGVNMTGEGLPGLRSFNITGGPPGPLKLIQ